MWQQDLGHVRFPEAPEARIGVRYQGAEE